MEEQLLAVCLRNRQDYELVKSYIDLRLSTYSKEFQVVMTKVGEYYARDDNAQHVVPDVLIAQIAETIRNPKHVTMFGERIALAIANTGSDANVRAVVLLAKKQEAADKLAAALVSGVTPKGVTIDELNDEWRKLQSMTELEELTESGVEVFHNVDLASLMSKEYDPSALIKLYPLSLSDKLDGGAKKGHHIVVYGRPESGKSMTVINMSCGIAFQGKKVLYFINEDRPEDIIFRHAYNLSGMTKHQAQADPDKANKLARERGFENIIVVSCSPGTPEMVEEEIERYEPDAIVLDQLRNFKVKADNRVNQLEYAASAARNIGKKCNVLTISVTQAGDSAEGKAVLDMGDVDYSNTGIPAQADVMIGVGVDSTLEAESRRMFSLPKNKISGIHDSFPVNVIPALSKVVPV